MGDDDEAHAAFGKGFMKIPMAARSFDRFLFRQFLPRL
jgi:hypothetical protein